MHLWNTKKLAEQIATNQLSSEAKFQYLLYSNILFAIATYLVWSFTEVTPTEFQYWFEALLVLIITIGGTLKCKQAFGTETDLSLIEAFFVLSLPLSIKMYLFTGIAVSLIPRGLWHIATTQSIIDSVNLDALEIFLNTTYDLHSIVIVVIATSWFYGRMAHHLTNVVKKTPNNQINRTENASAF